MKNVKIFDIFNSSIYIDFIALGRVFLRYGILLIILPLIGVTVSYFHSKRLPRYYMSAVIINPPRITDTGSGLSQTVAFHMDQHSDTDVVAAILNTNQVLDFMVNHLNLISYYKVTNKYQARGILQGATGLVPDPRSGFLAITVLDTHAEMAAKIANMYVNAIGWEISAMALDRIMQRRKFYEEEMGITRNKLDKAEEDLKSFSLENGVLAGDQLHIITGIDEHIQAELLNDETKLYAMQHYATADNPDYLLVKHQIETLKNQLAAYSGKNNSVAPSLPIPVNLAPALSQKYVSLMREYRLREDAFSLITRQYEFAKLDEQSDLEPFTVQVIDKAEPPRYIASPNVPKILRRGLNIGFSFALAAILLFNCRKFIKITPVK